MSVRGTMSGVGVAIGAVGLVVIGGWRTKTIPVARDRVIEVIAGDYYFQAPDTVAAGAVRIRFENHGAEHHHMQIVRVEGDHSVEEVAKLMSGRAVEAPWITFVGGPGAPPPMGASEVVLNLTPGRHVLLCFISAKDGVRHLMKGMLRQLIVSPDKAAPTRSLAGDADMVLGDYSFTLARQLKPGKQTIRVENRGEQSHEVGIFAAAPGVTEEQVRQWLIKPVGPAPGTPVGGAMALSPGESNLVVLDVPVGKLVLLCFVPDRTDHRPHVAHRMIRFLQVE